MNSFLRPEALAALVRWREALIGAALFAAGGWFAYDSFGVARAFGLTVMLIGMAFVIEGVRRARLPKDGGGVGMVEIDERQITYLTAGGGGAVSVDRLIRIEVHTTAAGPHGSDFFWVFHDSETGMLAIPGDAEGAQDIFDAISVLPGVDYENVIKASGSTEQGVFPVWRKDPARLH